MSTPGGPPPEQDPPTQQFPGRGAHHRGSAQDPGAAGGGGPRRRRWLPVAGGVLGVLVLLGALVFFLGSGAPAVGDCIRSVGTDQFETVDCGSGEAEYRVVGTDEDMTRAEFDADPDTCAAVDGWTAALWSGTDEAEDGDVYCAEAV